MPRLFEEHIDVKPNPHNRSGPKREIWYFKVNDDVYQGDTAEEAVSEYLSERKG